MTDDSPALEHAAQSVPRDSPARGMIFTIKDDSPFQHPRLPLTEGYAPKAARLRLRVSACASLACKRGPEWCPCVNPGHPDPITAALLDKGALLLGSTAVPPMCTSAVTESPGLNGPTRNGADPLLTPGGSSGGAAVAVQTGICHVALATDIAGSIRTPAAFTGTIGVKPPAAFMPRGGSTGPMSCGVIARSVADVAFTFDTLDLGPAAHSFEDALAGIGASGVQSPVRRVAFLACLPSLVGVQSDIVTQACNAFVAKLQQGRDAPFSITSISSLGWDRDASALAGANWANLLVAYELVRARKEYGAEAEAVTELWKREVAGNWETLRSTSEGRVRAAELLEGYAAHRKEVTDQHLPYLFRRFDAVITPATPVLPWRVQSGDCPSPHDAFPPLPSRYALEPLSRMTWWNEYAYIFNWADAAAATLPCGYTLNERGFSIPIGLQVAVRPDAADPAAATLRLVEVLAHLERADIRANQPVFGVAG